MTLGFIYCYRQLRSHDFHVHRRCSVPGCCDPKEHHINDMMTLGFMSLDILLADELTQIHGLVYVADFTGFGFAHAWAIDKKEVERCTDNLQVITARCVEGGQFLWSMCNFYLYCLFVSVAVVLIVYCCFKGLKCV